MIDKNMAEVLHVAAAIIRNELVCGSEIKIPGFGKFYTTEIIVGGKRFGKDTDEEERVVEVVRFKPFTQLKKAINDQETVQVEEPDRDWVKSVCQKVAEGEPDRNEVDLNSNVVVDELEATVTNETKVETDVTDHVVDVDNIKIEEEKFETDDDSDDDGGGLLGGFGGSGSALLGG